jgi:hypothetical protein
MKEQTPCFACSCKKASQGTARIDPATPRLRRARHERGRALALCFEGPGGLSSRPFASLRGYTAGDSDSVTEPSLSADTEGTAERRRGNRAAIRLTTKGRIQSFVTERRETDFLTAKAREGARRRSDSGTEFFNHDGVRQHEDGAARSGGARSAAEGD